MKKLIAFILSLVCIWSLTGCMFVSNNMPVATLPTPTAPPETEPPVGNQIGNRCPGYTLPIVDAGGETGETVNPAQTGKVTVINFWGTWCGPCVSELPHFDELAKNYADTVSVIAIHSTQSWKNMPVYLEKNYPDSQIIFSWENTKADNGEYYLMFDAQGYYPYTVVLDAQGIITFTHVGMMSYEDIQQAVENAGAVESKAPETKPTESAVPTEAPVNTKAQVEDAYSCCIETTYGGNYCYHIPKIILPNGLADNINRTMYSVLYPMVEEAETAADSYFDYIIGMQYKMWQSGDVISVVVTITQPYNDFVEYYVYNLSAATGNQLSDNEIYKHFGLSPSQGQQKLTKYLDNYWAENSSTEYISEEEMLPFIQDSYSEEYLADAAVFVGPNGAMCFTTKIGVPAGAGFFNTLIDPSGELFSIQCDVPGHEPY